jgi:hypothetical protein
MREIHFRFKLNPLTLCSLLYNIGCLGIVVGHPLDTIKVRLQSQGQLYKGMVDCIKTTMRREGAGGFWKGLGAPLAGNAPINALLFAGYEHGIRSLRKYDGERYKNKDSRPPIAHVMAAGSYAGLIQCVVMSPTELIKCQMQTNTSTSGSNAGSWGMVQKVVREQGFRNGLFRGFWATVLRDVPSCGIYFGVYEAIKRKLNNTIGVVGSSTSLFSTLIAGGLAGCALWASIYPLDLVKSRIQSLPMNTPASERGIITVFRKTYREGGLRTFTRGFGTTMARAIPSNAVTLASYELFISHLRELTFFEESHLHSTITYPIYYY